MSATVAATATSTKREEIRKADRKKERKTSHISQHRAERRRETGHFLCRELLTCSRGGEYNDVRKNGESSRVDEAQEKCETFW